MPHCKDCVHCRHQKGRVWCRKGMWVHYNGTQFEYTQLLWVIYPRNDRLEKLASMCPCYEDDDVHED